MALWPFRRPVSIQTVLIFPFLLQVLSIVGVVAYLSYRSGQRAIETVAFQLTEEISDRVGDRLTTYLETPQDLLALNRRLLESGDNGELSNVDSTQLAQQFWQQLQTFSSVNSIGLTQSTGQYIGVSRRPSLSRDAYSLKIFTRSAGAPFDPPASSAPAASLGREPDSLEPALSAAIGRERTYRLDANGEPQAEKASDLALRRTPLAPIQATWADIYALEGGQELLLTARAPIYADSQRQGGLEADIALSSISQFLNGLNVSQTGQVVIMERSGYLVATSTQEPLLMTDPKDGVRRLRGEDSADVLTQSVVAAIRANAGDLAAVQEQHFQFDSADAASNVFDQRYFASVAAYQDNYGLDWLIVVVIPSADFSAALRENIRQTVIWSGFALLGAIAVGLYTTRRIVQPILGLRDSANHIAQGDHTIHIPSTPITELRQLAFSFREMSNQLELSFEELKALNADLVEGQRQLEKFMDAIPVGVAIHRTDGAVSYLNCAAKRLFGIGLSQAPNPSEVALSYQLYVVGTGQPYPAKQLPIYRALQGEYTIVEDVGIQRGTIQITAEVRATPIFSEEGTITHAIVVFQDITSRKDAEKVLSDYSSQLQEEVRARTEDLMQQIQEKRAIEATLRQNEATIRAILSAIPDLMLRLKADGSYLERLSGGEIKSLGEDQELPGRNLRDFLPPHLARLRMHQIRQALATGEIQVSEYQVQINGEPQDEESRVVRLSNNEVLVIVRDISDRKRAEVALKQSEARNRAILAAIPDLMFRVSSNGILLGYIRTDALKDLVPKMINPVGRHLSDYLPPEFLQRELAALKEALATGTLQMYEQENWFDGQVQYEEVRVVPSGEDEVLFLIRDISDRKYVEQELRLANLRLEQLAQTDGLTQVANRRHFDERLQREWHRLLHEQKPISLLLFDVDYFKLYNDQYGHQAGDGCLIQIAQAAQQATLHPTDLVARYGGEEFAIVLPNTSTHGAVIVAQRLRQSIRAIAIPHQLSTISSFVTVSMGISSLVPSAQNSPRDWVIQADQALYAAKQQGRDRYLIFTPDVLSTLPPHNFRD